MDCLYHWASLRHYLGRARHCYRRHRPQNGHRPERHHHYDHRLYFRLCSALLHKASPLSW